MSHTGSQVIEISFILINVVLKFPVFFFQGLSGISRTPSTSAIYERIRAGRDAIAQQRGQRFTFSAENINLLDRNLEVRLFQ